MLLVERITGEQHGGKKCHLEAHYLVTVGLVAFLSFFCGDTGDMCRYLTCVPILTKIAFCSFSRKM